MVGRSGAEKYDGKAYMASLYGFVKWILDLLSFIVIIVDCESHLEIIAIDLQPCGAPCRARLNLVILLCL